MQIYVADNQVLVSWGTRGPLWSLNSDGSVSEQLRVQGDLVWEDGQDGFDFGYAVGHADGFEQACRDAVTPTAAAS